MKSVTVHCSECNRKRVCILLQVCIPLEDVDLPHEKVLDISICPECVSKMGTMGMWIAHAAEAYYARNKS